MHLCKKHSSVIYNSFIKGIGSLACRLRTCSSGARAAVACGRGLRQAVARTVGTSAPTAGVSASSALQFSRPAAASQTIDATYNGAR